MANLLGIDIGPNSVRGVLVKTQLRRVQLVQYIDVPIVERAPNAEPEEPAIEVPMALDPGAAPPDPVALGAVLQAAPPNKDAAAHAAADAADAADRALADSPLGRAVAELVRQAGGTGLEILAALPGDAVSLRRVELPKAAEKKLEELLPFEMESVLPFELEDTLLDHQLIDSDATQIRLMVSAAPKTRIREELERLAALGADPIELVPAPAALGGLAQFVPGLATPGPHMVVVLGRQTTDVCVIRAGRAELARTLSIGVQELLGRHEAMLFSAFATSGPSLDTAAANHLGRELKQTLLAYRMQGGGELETLSLGGDASVPGLLEWLGEHLSRSVIPLALPEVAGAIGPNANPALATDPIARLQFTAALAAVGHSLLRGKHLDFRTGEFVKKRDLSILRDFGPILGIASAAVGFAFLFSIWARWSVLEDRRALLEDELARVTESQLGEETRDLDRARSLLETGRHTADPMPAFTAFDALVAVSNAVPDGVTHDLSRLSIDLSDGRSEGHVEIQGTVSTVDDAERISRGLAEEPCFRNLELGPATNTPDGRRNYRIEGDILCPGTEPRPTRRRGSSSGSSSSSTGGEG